jgi:hypothetical protein
MHRRRIRRKLALLAALTTATCWATPLGCLEVFLASMGATLF